MTDEQHDLVALEPCPFCGGEAEIERMGDRRASTIYRCCQCGCSLETGEEWGHGGQWNARQYAKHIAALESRNRVLREALEPFAIFGNIITSDPAMALHADDTPAAILLFTDGVRRTLTFGDLRRARAALAGDAG